MMRSGQSNRDTWMSSWSKTASRRSRSQLMATGGSRRVGRNTPTVAGMSTCGLQRSLTSRRHPTRSEAHARSACHSGWLTTRAPRTVRSMRQTPTARWERTAKAPRAQPRASQWGGTAAADAGRWLDMGRVGLRASPYAVENAGKAGSGGAGRWTVADGSKRTMLSGSGSDRGGSSGATTGINRDPARAVDQTTTRSRADPLRSAMVMPVAAIRRTRALREPMARAIRVLIIGPPCGHLR